ncbi:DUF4083 family protein [Sporosarcina sp. 179-K 8C2 HS]|uniref:DUF4083 family protein n=1 Tax=Sporosarcina sp. 179-K 8C2 HS TaxID=3142387 RepID=UPI00399FA633
MILELLLYILLIAFIALIASSLLGNQKKYIQSNRRIEKKLEKIIELLGKEQNNK